jgi:amino acid adenylation domain-containing protein
MSRWPSDEAWNHTQQPYPHDRCIHHLVEDACARWPDAVAVVLGDRRLTYRELDRQANRLAARLRRLGVGPDVLVGIYARRSLEMVIGILAVLKAGGAYVPLDPDYPRERLALMIESAALRLIVAQPELAGALPPHGATVVPLESEAGDAGEAPAVDGGARPLDGAYIIFTSGSTGRPKGIVLTHQGLCNMIPDWNRLFGVRPESRVLQFASLSFDASVWEVFSALIAGATLCFGGRATLYSAAELLRMLRELHITHALLPPSLLGALTPEDLPELESVAAIGEKCSGAIVERWGPGRVLCNAYGPAETTITVSVHLADPARRYPNGPPIGRPMANCQLHVLDEHQQPVPLGTPGELCVGGVNLGRGYLGHAGLTAEKFVPDPFSGEPGARLYRTGDLARRLPDGEIEFLGRIDHQVKVRGVRIELGEIEATLREHPAVQDAIVVALPGERRADDVRLAAYVVPSGESVPTARELRVYLARRLPEPMIPGALVTLPELPLSPNGKVDRRALPAPSWEPIHAAAEHVAPRGETEQLLAAIWGEVLRVSAVGVHDNFFELGGDSVLSIQVIERAASHGLRLTPKLLYKHQTVAELARAVEAGGPPP